MTSPAAPKIVRIEAQEGGNVSLSVDVGGVSVLTELGRNRSRSVNILPGFEEAGEAAFAYVVDLFEECVAVEWRVLAWARRKCALPLRASVTSAKVDGEFLRMNVQAMGEPVTVVLERDLYTHWEGPIDPEEDPARAWEAVDAAFEYVLAHREALAQQGFQSHAVADSARDPRIPWPRTGELDPQPNDS